MKDVIQNKLEDYNPQTKEDEENAIKEITQEIILYGLSESGFFEHAAFQGGTCLRIIHQLDRFSEDLDFALRSPSLNFNLDEYLKKVSETMRIYGYEIEISGEDKADSNVKSRFLKDDSIKKLLHLEHKHEVRKKIQIKIEIDAAPPADDRVESNYIDFPTQSMIMTHDIPSLLAGKTHALLCRPFVKGRDWYDYLWYVSKGASININMLKNALNQHGPWKDKQVDIDKEWLRKNLNQKIKSINWNDAKKDIDKFLRPEKKKSLQLWSEDFFLKMTDKFISRQTF